MAFTTIPSWARVLLLTDPNGLLEFAQCDLNGNLITTSTSKNVQSNIIGNNGQFTIGLVAQSILASNINRKKLILQNVGTTVIKIGFGITPTQSSYHIAIPACGFSNDGSSQPYIDIMWIGEIQAISSGVGGGLTILEMI